MKCVALSLVLFNLTLLGRSKIITRKDSSNVKKDAQAKFADLLQEMIKINEERFEAMKQLTRLQEKTLSSNFLRSKNDDTLGILAITSTPVMVILGGHVLGRHSLFKLEKLLSKWKKIVPPESSSSLESEFADNLIMQFPNFITRRRNEIFCVKTASRLCKRSCIKSYRDTCLRYKCTRKLRKRAKSNCKRTCKKEFNKGKYEDSDTD
ncbi:hypothetical protein evm_010388 [Chilo suppressalis]|nr:hypothetical protein evm_010388 [Chilo suppressalis]